MSRAVRRHTLQSVIREYNVRQGQLRGKGTFGEAILQQASNAVGLNLASSILDATLLGGTVPNDGQGRLLAVQEIGMHDLLGVRDTLYPGNETLGTELYVNQAWPGVVMLGALGGRYTDRLLRYDDQNQPVTLDTLADFKSLLLCWGLFQYAFQTDDAERSCIDHRSVESADGKKNLIGKLPQLAALLASTGMPETNSFMDGDAAQRPCGDADSSLAEAIY